MAVKNQNIQKLTSDTINQIAAGEVIENPASVVKELFENSVDAGATQITIDIEAGGFALIRISDDGTGMGSEDALLAFERHATSKLRSIDDLSTILTMGFRGEALASIDSISHMQLTTALEGETATQVKGAQALPAARVRGTTIEIRSLFYNVPARRKFQKSPSASTQEIVKQVHALSLAHPRVGIILKSAERALYTAPPSTHGDWLDALSDKAKLIHGEDFAETCFKVDFHEDGFKVRGFIGAPSRTRTNRTGQALFINERPIVSPLLSFAVKDGYGTRIEMARHPIFALHLEVDPKSVDVNVHPQKREVRFRDERSIRRLVTQAVSIALGGGEIHTPLPPQVEFTLPKESGQPIWALKEEAAQTLFAPQETVPYPLGIYHHLLLFDAKGFTDEQLERMGIKKREGLLRIDLKEVERTLRYEEMDEKRCAAQRLLLPITLKLTLDESSAILSQIEALHALGFEIRELCEYSFIIEAIPAFLTRESAPKLLQDVLHDEAGTLVKRIACHAQSQKMRYTLHEGHTLLTNLFKGKQVRLSPNGKNIAELITHDTLNI